MELLKLRAETNCNVLHVTMLGDMLIGDTGEHIAEHAFDEALVGGDESMISFHHGGVPTGTILIVVGGRTGEYAVPARFHRLDDIITTGFDA